MVPARGRLLFSSAAGTKTLERFGKVPLTLGLAPAHHRLRHAVGGGEIGLDVEQRRAVQAVEPDHREDAVLDAAEASPRSWRSGWGGPASATQRCRAGCRSGGEPAAPGFAGICPSSRAAPDGCRSRRPSGPRASADRPRRCRPRPIHGRFSGSPCDASRACGCGRCNRGRRRLPAARPPFAVADAEILAVMAVLSRLTHLSARNAEVGSDQSLRSHSWSASQLRRRSLAYRLARRAFQRIKISLYSGKRPKQR